MNRNELNTARSDKGSHPSEFNWVPIIYFYIVYFGILFIGGITNTHTAFIGAAIFLVFLFLWYWRYLLSTKIDKLFFCVAFSIVLPIVPMVLNDSRTFLATFQEIIKYYALNFVILIGASLPLTPISRCKRSRWLYVIILLFLIVGWLWPTGRDVYQSRVKGFLTNPNNFALTAMMLFFLIDEKRSRASTRRINHIIVIFLTYISRTSGALLGYVGGIVYLYIFSKNNRLSVIRFLTVTGVAVASIIIFLSIPPNTLRPVDEVVKKLSVTKQHLPEIFSKKRINFYEIEQKEKQNTTSGLWRLYQWNRIMNYYLDSSMNIILFGHGIGTTDIYFKLKSHNDYLRLLFETGMIGFLFNISIWVILYRRMDVKYRWPVLMIAFFCFTENNYDHFPAMTLLVFYMIGANKDTVARLM